MIRALALGLLIIGTAPAFAADPFMAIHLDNQKIDSAVSLQWRSLRSGVTTDPFMAIHISNQQDGSAVVAFWDAYAPAADRLPTLRDQTQLVALR